MPFSVISHNNKEVLFINHRGLGGDDLLSSFRDVNKFMLEQKKKFRSVADFTDTTMSKELNEYLKSDETKEVSQYTQILALVGITGIKKMASRIYGLLTGVKQNIFDTIEEALDFVTKD